MSDFALHGVDLFGEKIKPKASGPLAERFTFPPFSVLDARQGEWQERKRQWLALGIQSELGRNAEVFGIGDKAEWEKRQSKIHPGGGNDALRIIGSSEKYGVNAHLSESAQRALGCFAAYGETVTDRGQGSATGTSIFDPVLTELAYRWFCPAGGQIVDPFAGGSVRGLIAGLLGYRYLGIDLRHEQVQANEAQREVIAPESDVLWLTGDSMQLMEQAPAADFIFSCPPYGDLERYSDNPADLSTMEYHTFLAAYKRIILRCAKQMADNSFACFVVGDFRDRATGLYRGFVADTIQAFRECGLGLYNEAILVTAVGSLPVRVSNQFPKSRKLGKTHQNMLIFCKGDWRTAAEKCNVESA